jgi:hypothetical protein
MQAPVDDLVLEEMDYIRRSAPDLAQTLRGPRSFDDSFRATHPVLRIPIGFGPLSRITAEESCEFVGGEGLQLPD